MVQNPMFRNGLVDGIFHLAKDELPLLATEYVAAMETQVTSKWCRCKWIIHPDDGHLLADQCRQCKVVKSEHDFAEDDENAHAFIGRRQRRGEQHPQCSVHTKEGFILGFFEWVFAEPSSIQLNPIISKEDAKQLVDQFKEKYDIPPELP
jgi:hypothetical protein